MFKKTCSRCKKKISKGYEFCPFCGYTQKSEYDREDYGILGKNDFIEENFLNSGDSFMERMFDNAFKIAEKIMEKHLKEFPEEVNKNRIYQRKINPKFLGLDIQFSVNGERVFPQNQEAVKKQKIQTSKTNELSKEKLNKFAKFPKAEPESRVRRLSGKIIYEIEVPGVNNINDIFINRLENSIEIKALSNDKVYSKILNINLPILGYSLKQGNLILELAAR